MRSSSNQHSEMSSSFRGYGAPDMADLATADVRRGADVVRKSSQRRKSTDKMSASTGRLAAASDSAKSTGSLPALPGRSPLKGQTSPSTTGKRGGGFGGLQGKRMDTEAQLEFLNGKLKQAQGALATKNQAIVSSRVQQLPSSAVAGCMFVSFPTCSLAAEDAYRSDVAL